MDFLFIAEREVFRDIFMSKKSSGKSKFAKIHLLLNGLKHSMNYARGSDFSNFARIIENFLVSHRSSSSHNEF